MRKTNEILMGLICLIVFMLFVSATTMIYDCSDLQDMNLNLAENYQLANNIDCSATSGWNGGNGFIPVGDNTTQFTGNFDGQGYNIINLWINRTTDYIGIFGYTNLSNIENVGISGNIIGHYYVGGLVGINGGIINNCFVIGNVSGVRNVGGLGGDNFDTGIISNSYSTADINGIEMGGSFNNVGIGGLVGSNGFFFAGGIISNSYATGNVNGDYQATGGLVGGWNRGIINNSYATGGVSGYTSTGGLVGFNGNGYGETYDGIIINSYSTGSVNGAYSYTGGLVGLNYLANCYYSYWDIETSGQGSSGCGEGKTTLEMKTQSNFTTWDFFNIWGIQEGTTYPYLLNMLSFCGNGICEVGEDSLNCLADCPPNPPMSWEEVNLDEHIVDPENTNQGLLPSVYFGMATFLSNVMTPAIIIIFVIFFVMIIGTIGVIIKKIATSI